MNCRPGAAWQPGDPLPLDARILIVGGPRSGKTTLALRMAAESISPVRHTDSLIGECGWGQDSERVADWISEPGPWIIEGVAAARALRKWLARDAGGHERPCERVIVCTAAWVELTPRQSGMADGVALAFGAVRGELAWRRVEVVWL